MSLECEILVGGPPTVGKDMMVALADAAPKGCVARDNYVGDREVLFIYGASHYVERLETMRAHMLKGGTVIAWDKGYWQRENSLRFSVNALHPTSALLDCAPYTVRRLITLREDFNPDGPIVLIGHEVRGESWYSSKDGEWERKALEMIKDRWPHKEVHYRPRNIPFLELPDTILRIDGGIEDVLRGAAMVVCRHSNVGVDAAIAGIPVMCEEGAASVLYADGPYVSTEQRREFLQKLGWFNWAIPEARQAWRFIGRLLKGRDTDV